MGAFVFVPVLAAAAEAVSELGPGLAEPAQAPAITRLERRVEAGRGTVAEHLDRDLAAHGRLADQTYELRDAVHGLTPEGDDHIVLAKAGLFGRRAFGHLRDPGAPGIADGEPFRGLRVDVL